MTTRLGRVSTHDPIDYKDWVIPVGVSNLPNIYSILFSLFHTVGIDTFHHRLQSANRITSSTWTRLFFQNLTVLTLIDGSALQKTVSILVGSL